MKLKNENIICFAGEDWWYHNPHSNLHLMKCFAKENRVLFVNSIGLRMPNLLGNKKSWVRIFKKLKSLFIFLRKAEPNIYVLTPWAIPVFRRFAPTIAAVNGILLKIQLLWAIKFLKFSKPVIWASLPTFKDIVLYLKRKHAKALVYYCVDNISYHPEVDQKYVFSLEAELQRNADVAFFVNHKLVEERKSYNPNLHFLPHGVDYEHFASCQDGLLAVPEDIAHIPKPMVGYMGVIFGLDYDLVRYLAKKNPNVSFVFIGEVQEDISKVEKLPNVFFLGKKPYELVSNYLQELSCHCIFYDTKDTFNNYRNPKKLKEYLATGTPVVATTNLEIAYYREYVHVAESYEDFHQLLGQALTQDTQAMRQKRIAYARQQTWEDVAAFAAGLITDVMKSGKD
jgi:glycosyltransferase involved in cell wall biosynthesis